MSDDKPTWEISGAVDGFDMENGQITLWLSGFDEMETIPIMPEMPAWLFRSGIAFRTSIPRACVRRRSFAGNTRWGEFHKQDYQNLSEAELLELLAEMFE